RNMDPRRSRRLRRHRRRDNVHRADPWWPRGSSRSATDRSAVADMQYMIIESFRGGDPVPVYRRFRDRGRLAPEGLRYVSSWVTQDLTRCYQVMECEDRALLDQWMANWRDVTD